jgi:DNA-binding HxlR family transcriptional regulator
MHSITDVQSMTNSTDDLGEAGLFEAISHETRIHALFELRINPTSFSELKRKLGISSSGNLQHHIRKLGPLIHLSSTGLYELTDQGRESLLAIRAVRNMQNRVKSNLNALVVIGIVAYYIVQMNVPFLFGNVTPLTPLLALLGTAVFGVISYVLWSAAFRVCAERGFEKSNDAH